MTLTDLLFPIRFRAVVLSACISRHPWLLSLVTAALLLLVLDQAAPLNLRQQPGDFARIVVDRQGYPLRAFADDAGVWRYPVRLDEVSDYYLQALINYEDRWFYLHPGINPLAIARAALQNLRQGEVVSGASTLSMQVARLLHPQSPGVWGKVQQALRALQLELHLSKAEILTLYLNYAPFGGNLEGVQAASFAYFSKPASDLTRAEAALLAVMPQAPSRFRPDRHPQRAQQARDKLLDRLAVFGVWPAVEVADAKQEQVAAYRLHQPQIAPLLARRLINTYPQQSRIQSTIDSNLQQQVSERVRQYIQSFPAHTSAAVLVMENASQAVRAYIGSADFSDEQRFAHVDMVRAIRSPGSTLKPFLYGMAMDTGLVHSESLLSDVPRQFAAYQPENFYARFSGPVSLSQALQQSLNLPAVQVLEHLGPASFAAKLANAGMRLQLPPQAQPSLAVILGGAGLSLEQLVAGYSALARQGQVISPRYTADEAAAPPRYLLSPEAAWIIQRILTQKAPAGRVRSQHFVQQQAPLAWKTGTSYGFRDAWAIGVNADYTIGVWLGRPDGTPLPGHFGAASAGPLLFAVADGLPQLTTTAIPQPEHVTEEEICWPLGGLRRLQAPEHCQQTRLAWLIDHTAPPSLPEMAETAWLQNPYSLWINPKNARRVAPDCWVADAKQIQVALWPKRLEPWLPWGQRRNQLIPPADKTCSALLNSATGNLEIIGLAEAGGVYLPTTKTEVAVQFKTLGGIGQQQWFLNGAYQATTSSAQAITIRLAAAGDYQLAVVDSSGNAAVREFTVY